MVRRIPVTTLVGCCLLCGLAWSGDTEKSAAGMAEGHVSAFYRCDMGDTLTVYRNPGDETYVNLRWHGKVRRMEREITTTGAGRYENKKEGLLLISIPSKSMLFDSRKGRQLANECRTTEQLADNTARTETQAEAKPKSRAKRRRRR